MAFVIVNADDTIHSFQAGEYEELDTGMQRFDIGAMPDPVDVECYTWDNVNNVIVLKSQTDIDAIIASRKTEAEKLEKRALQGEIDKITALETSDPNEDYSVEKAVLQAKLDALKA